jgi:hypothetical protein
MSSTDNTIDFDKIIIINDWKDELMEKERIKMENDKRPYLVHLYDEHYFRRRIHNKIILPKFKDEGYSEEDFEYIKKGTLPPHMRGGIYDDEGNCLPVANSILYEKMHMQYLRKKREKRRAISMKNHFNKNDFKVYLNNHPKDTIVSKTVLALLLAQKIKWC